MVPNPRFSLHAQTLVQAKDRKKLEKLIRYLARPAVANKRRISWAKLLARVFNIDVEVCSSCGGNVRIVAAITAKSTIQKILTHINLPLDPPMPDPARAPPQLSFSDVDAGTFDDSADFDQRSPENY